MTSFQSLKSSLTIENTVSKSYDSAFNKLKTLVLSLAPGALIFFSYSSGKPYSTNFLQLSSKEGYSNFYKTSSGYWAFFYFTGSYFEPFGSGWVFIIWPFYVYFPLFVVTVLLLIYFSIFYGDFSFLRDALAPPFWSLTLLAKFLFIFASIGAKNSSPITNFILKIFLAMQSLTSTLPSFNNFSKLPKSCLIASSEVLGISPFY